MNQPIPKRDAEAIPPYPFIGNFTISLHCIMCLREVPHTEEQHDILRNRRQA